MDALSDVLQAFRLAGGVFLEAEFTAPWCVTARVGPEDCRPFMANPAHMIAYHYVIEGTLLLQVEAEPPVEVRAGQIVLLPRNDPHRLGSTLAGPAISADDLIQPPADGGLARIAHGGGGPRTRIVCGFLGTAIRHNPLVGTLPRVLCLAVQDGSPSGDWMTSSFQYAASALNAGAGSAGVLARLSELLFAEAMRRYVAALPPGQSGWLSGLRDPVVGRALALLHRRSAQAWTAEALAREAGLSRSAFAERFTRLVGVAPMSYLASWRMQLAAQRLRDGDQPVAAIAFEVGYESEAAFNRAFKREFGAPPATWRRRARSVGASAT